MSFVRAEVDPTPRLRRYELRGSSLSFYLRHHTTDIGALHEVFVDDVYEIPAAAKAAIARSPGQLNVLDLGGHIGMFGLFVLSRYPSARIVSVEPEPDNAGVLKRCIATNGREADWSVVRAAASNRIGQHDFRAGEGMDSSLFGAESAPNRVQVELVDVFKLLEGVDLLKMDIEGGEWDVLSDPRLATVDASAVVLEYHGAGCPESDPRSCAERLLREAGFVVHHMDEPGTRRGLCWTWRP